jgi:hypothetical protein
MLQKIKAAWEVLQLGKSLADPQKWKSRQVRLTTLGGFFIGVAQLAKMFNYDIYLDEDTATAIAAAIIAASNWYFTLATSTKVGVGSKPTGEALPQLAEADTISAPQEVVIEDHSINK